MAIWKKKAKAEKPITPDQLEEIEETENVDTNDNIDELKDDEEMTNDLYVEMYALIEKHIENYSMEEIIGNLEVLKLDIQSAREKSYNDEKQEQ